MARRSSLASTHSTITQASKLLADLQFSTEGKQTTGRPSAAEADEAVLAQAVYGLGSRGGSVGSCGGGGGGGGGSNDRGSSRRGKCGQDTGEKPKSKLSAFMAKVPSNHSGATAPATQRGHTTGLLSDGGDGRDGKTGDCSGDGGCPNAQAVTAVRTTDNFKWVNEPLVHDIFHFAAPFPALLALVKGVCPRWANAVERMKR